MKIGIESLDEVLERMRSGGDTQLWHYANSVEVAVKQFLASKDSCYCTNTECPLKKALAEGMLKL